MALSSSALSGWCTASFLTEVVMTLFFLVVILGVTSMAAPAGVAFFANAGAVPQPWLFWVAPIVGALFAIYLSRGLQKE